MPHSISAAKRVRQNIKSHLRNKKVKTELRSLIKKLLSLVATKKKEEALKVYLTLTSKFDKAAKKGIIHRNNANRHKSRLVKRLTQSFA